NYDAATPASGGLVTVPTAAGVRITVARSLAERFVGFVGDLVAAGHNPRAIGCYASGGHIRGSNHYVGAACDIDQLARNQTARYMYDVRALTARWGLRDGCVFGDCGHVEVPQHYAYAARHTSVRHFAARRHARRYARQRRYAG